MKRIIAFISIAIGFFSLSTGQTLEEKEQELFKKYNVKTRTNWDYTFKDSKFSMEGKKTSLSTYDRNGRVLEIKVFNPKGETSLLEKFAYDTKGNRTFYERQSLSGEYKKQSEYDEESNLIQEYGYDGSATFGTKFSYDSKDRVTEIVYLIADEIDEKRVYTYTGNKATVDILKNGKFLSSKVSLTFNSQNQVIKEEVSSVDGKVLESRTMEYNSIGKITKEEKYKSGQLIYRQTYDYDSKNELLSISEENSNEAKYIKKLYKYDDLGRVIEYQWKRNSADDYNIKVFKYGDKGVCSEEHTYYPKTNYKLLTKYEYDFY
ncbi:MAG: hypothetical protein JXB34_11875 [Bacteroidales bacterium]|nr:hypothetical protein [Bacteroidales bacterium]